MLINNMEKIKTRIRNLKELNKEIEEHLLLKQRLFNELNDELICNNNFDELLVEEIGDLMLFYIANQNEISRYEKFLKQNDDVNEYCRGYMISRRNLCNFK